MTAQRHADRDGPVPPLRVHFVNNVLATAASYVEEDPGLARDLLADLGSYLAYRLREDFAPVALDDELDVVRTYLRLEHARHGERLEARVEEAPAGRPVRATPLALQSVVEEVVSRRLAGAAALRILVRPAGDGAAVRVDVSDLPDGDDPERMVVELQAAT